MIKLPHPNIWKLFVIKGSLWFMVIMPIIVLFFQDNGLNLYKIMILQACYSLSLGLTEIPSGYAADILGRKKTLILGCVLAFVGFSIFSISYDFWWFLAAEILLGLGNSFISGADTALMYDSLLEVKAEDRFLKYEGRSISIGNFSEAAAGILGGFLAAISFRYPAYAQVLVALIAIPFAISLKEPKMHKERLKSSWKSIMGVVKFSLVESKILRTYIIYSSAIGIGTLMMAWLAQPFLKDIGIGMKNYGMLWALLNIIVGVFAFLAHKIERRFTELNSLLFVGLFSVLGYMLLANNMNYVGLFILFIFYANRGYATPLLRNYINHHTESNVRATVMSVRSFIIRTSFAIIAPFIGWIADQQGLSTAFFVMGLIITVAGGLCLVWFVKNQKQTVLNR
ncbi:MAG: MFS transporter [Flavobacteriales bacterium]|nr:MFS transporter [Flavobacteriales bacterium]